MLDDIYNARILELAGNIPRISRLEAPDALAKAAAPDGLEPQASAPYGFAKAAVPGGSVILLRKSNVR